MFEIARTKGYKNLQKNLEYSSLSLFLISSVFICIFCSLQSLFWLLPVCFGFLYAISFVMKSFSPLRREYNMGLIFPELIMGEDVSDKINSSSSRGVNKSQEICDLKNELMQLKKEIEQFKN